MPASPSNKFHAELSAERGDEVKNADHQEVPDGGVMDPSQVGTANGKARERGKFDSACPERRAPGLFQRQEQQGKKTRRARPRTRRDMETT
jgi:hypothetical protein